jgi:LysM repeat protein
MHLIPDDHGRRIRHIVRKGETPSGIAKRYRVSLASLKKSNKNLNIIRPGQIIIVVQKTGHKRQDRMTKSKAPARKLVQKTADLKPVSSKATPDIPKSNLY